MNVRAVDCSTHPGHLARCTPILFAVPMILVCRLDGVKIGQQSASSAGSPIGLGAPCLRQSAELHGLKPGIHTHHFTQLSHNKAIVRHLAYNRRTMGIDDVVKVFQERYNSYQKLVGKS